MYVPQVLVKEFAYIFFRSVQIEFTSDLQLRKHFSSLSLPPTLPREIL